MSDDQVFRPRKIDPNAKNPLDTLVENAQIRAAAQGSQSDVEARGESYTPSPLQNMQNMQNVSRPEIQGNLPPEFSQMLNNPQESTPKQSVMNNNRNQFKSSSGNGLFHQNTDLSRLIGFVKESSFNYDEVILPSLGRFYSGEDGPTSGILHIRPMSGKEEEILATPRWNKSGKAMNMILQACIKEQVDPNMLLSIDRNYLIIFLRGISYGPAYEAEVKCPACSFRYPTVINLDELHVDECPENYSSQSLNCELPTTKLKFSYRLSNGYDDDDIQKYRERNAKFFGDKRNDDTLMERATQLLYNIDVLENKGDIKKLLEELPVSDTNYIRNLVNDPPFGVDMKVGSICPTCYEEFELDIPIESNFFFPRRVKETT